jgi:hypothetical protein
MLPCRTFYFLLFSHHIQNSSLSPSILNSLISGLPKVNTIIYNTKVIASTLPPRPTRLPTPDLLAFIETSLDRFPTTTESEDGCSICFESFTTFHLPLKFRECKHVFGCVCILRWLNKSNQCPLCRRELYIKGVASRTRNGYINMAAWAIRQTFPGLVSDNSNSGSTVVPGDSHISPRSTDTRDLFSIEQALEHQGQPRLFDTVMRHGWLVRRQPISSAQPPH